MIQESRVVGGGLFGYRLQQERTSSLQLHKSVNHSFQGPGLGKHCLVQGESLVFRFDNEGHLDNFEI